MRKTFFKWRTENWVTEKKREKNEIKQVKNRNKRGRKSNTDRLNRERETSKE
jgi:hypothetical protein